MHHIKSLQETPCEVHWMQWFRRGGWFMTPARAIKRVVILVASISSVDLQRGVVLTVCSWIHQRCSPAAHPACLRYPARSFQSSIQRPKQQEQFVVLGVRHRSCILIVHTAFQREPTHQLWPAFSWDAPRQETTLAYFPASMQVDAP